ncbi:zinc finger protein 382 isoform X2 [Folsomia candida]|uniref:zinc finger protein 382 isoform X2 n=1 Tax=Folsomia candida TaxID=158441 RepID=UPI001604FF09|nr:zinc finger protein 382 isoform X2 [Folsomia candida]
MWHEIRERSRSPSTLAIHPDISDDGSAASKGTERKPCSCPTCGKTFATSANQQRHVELIHFPDKTSCPYGCETQIDSEADWVTHLEGCDSPKMRTESQSVCPYCPRVFRNVFLKMEHRLRIHPANTYSCSTCGRIFTRKAVLDHHLCTITSEINHLNSKAESKYVCTFCTPNVTFSAAKNYMVHMRNKNIHPDIAAAHVSESKKFSCKICGVKFSRKSYLVRHMKNTNLHPDASDPNKISAGFTSKTGPTPSEINPFCQIRTTFHISR